MVEIKETFGKLKLSSNIILFSKLLFTYFNINNHVRNVYLAFYGIIEVQKCLHLKKKF